MWFSQDQTETNTARTPQELDFLHAVELSDVTSVKRLLEENPNLNVDVIDDLGRTALRLAVKNESRELIDILLTHCNSQNMNEAVLQAISEDKTSIADAILKHPFYLEMVRKRHRLGDTDGFFKTEAETQFSTDITPLNLAAQKNNYEIVQLLLQRGERIQTPHKFSCRCMECRNRMKFDQLRMANFRLNAFRGLASEVYISLSSEDPFLTGFQLARELRKLSSKEKHFKKEYKDLAKNISCYLVKLLDCVWTQEELELVLNKKGTTETEKFESLARLKMAVELKEKKFVAHPSVQQHLVNIWHQDVKYIEKLGWFTKLIFLLGMITVYPLLAIAHLFCPQSKWTKLAKQPMVKFMGHTISFLVFLLLVILSSTENFGRESSKITLESNYYAIALNYQTYRNLTGKDLFGKDFPLRPHQPTVNEFLLTIWIVGMLVQQLQQIAFTGGLAHFKSLVNVVDYLLLSGYITVLTLSQFAMYKFKLAIAELGSKNITMMLQNMKETEQHLYWLNTDRMLWSEMDPINLSESVFAVVNVLSFSRICHLLPANEGLGPMQISLGRMMNDILKFMAFLVIAWMAFIVSLRSLYWYYSDSDYGESIQEDKTNAATSFKDFIATFRTVFWWIYGRGALDELKAPDKFTNAKLTESVGNVISATYHIAIIIVLVNLLIAMMARSFEKTVFDIDSEWKYARCQLYMEYISPGFVLPVPLNTLELLRDGVLKLIARARKGAQPEEGALPHATNHRRLAYPNIAFTDVSEESPKRCKRSNEYATHQNSPVKSTYTEIMETIVQRYIFDIQREEELGREKVDEIRQNIYNTKWDLMELMEQRDASVRNLTCCAKLIASELTLLAPTSVGRKEGAKFRKLKDEKRSDKSTDYPKTGTLLSGSRL